MFEIVERADKGLAAIERTVVIVLTGGIAAIMMTQVLLRFSSGAPLFWAEEVAAQMLVAATLSGLSLLVHHGQLVAIDILPRMLPQRARQVLVALLSTVLLGLFVFLAWLGWQWIAQPPTRVELAATTQLPRWYSYVTLPIAVSLMALHQAVATLRVLRGVRP